ncbi:MAG TPA: branched-chain amino acid ABC transporter ATP-binding protein/permease [Streptosporangiaceae bacterium]|jgi:branched-chain amino acid transport system permease protein
MSGALFSYVATLFVYLGVNTIACWGLNLQFGVGGVMNFAFILFQAMGAYITAVLTLPRASTASAETYMLGWHLPWPLPLAGAAIAGAVLALAIGAFALRPQRRDFQATVMLVVSIIASTLVVTEQGWFNGGQGLFGIPQPFVASLRLTITGYEWAFAGITAVVALVVLLFTDRLTGSPWGRRLRAMRENPEAIESLGTSVRAESLKVYVIGGAIAAVSGGLLVEFIGAWSPAAWGTGETFIYFVAIIVGGLGNTFGAFFGAFLVLGVFLELPTYLPQIGGANTEESLQSAAIGVLILAFLWWRPQGIFPERRRQLSRGLSTPPPRPAPAAGGAAAQPARSAAARPAGSTAAQPAGPAEFHWHPPARAGGAAAAATLSVRDLSRDFGGVRAVDGLSFDLAPGQVTGLIGPNGAGKSTALKLIAGAIRPGAGHVVVDGADVAGRPAHTVARLGVIRTFQHTSEFARLTVLENLLTAAPGQPGDSLGGALLGRRHSRARQRELLGEAWSLLADFQLTAAADTYAGQLSGGQRRLVEIMRALMARPRVLLLDEPMAGVNPTLRLTIEEHLQRLRDDGLTMLMVEHELGSVERVCDSVIVMAQGKVLATGTMAELRQNQEVISAYLVG